MDEVAESGEEIVITKNGRPVSRLTPYREKPEELVWPRPGHHSDSRRHHGTDRRGVGGPDQPGPCIESVILLDTQVLLWSRFGAARLGRRARQQIERSAREGSVAVSAVSFWEVAMLHHKGRLTLLRSVASWRQALLQEGLVEIPMDGEIGIRAATLPDFHADPADRLIVATALEGHRLVTADRRILDWPGQLSRLDATQ